MARDPLLRQRSSWDERARANPEFYVDTTHRSWDATEWRASGEAIVADALAWGARGVRPTRALDLGCGPGRLAAALADRFAAVDAVDLSEEMLARARESGLPANVALHLVSGRDLAPLGDGDHDLVLSALVFQHVPGEGDVAALLAEVARVLVPGEGRALLQFDSRPASALARLLLALPDPLLPPTRRRGMRRHRRSPERLRALAAGAGLTVVAERGAGGPEHWLALTSRTSPRSRPRTSARSACA